MLTKLFIIIVMFFIFGILISGIIFLIRDQGRSNRTVKALTWRIGLSLSLFILLFVAFSLGLIHPHDLG
jgi:hypothetical protein